MRSFLGWWWGGCRGVLSFQTHMSQQRLFFLRLIHPLNETRHDSARPLTKDNCGFGQTFKDGVGGFGGWWWWRRGRGGGRKAAEVKSSFSPSVLRFTYNTTGTKGRSYTTVTPPHIPSPPPCLHNPPYYRRRRKKKKGRRRRRWRTVVVFFLPDSCKMKGRNREEELSPQISCKVFSVPWRQHTSTHAHTRAAILVRTPRWLTFIWAAFNQNLLSNVNHNWFKVQHKYNLNHANFKPKPQKWGSATLGPRSVWFPLEHSSENNV